MGARCPVDVVPASGARGLDVGGSLVGGVSAGLPWARGAWLVLCRCVEPGLALVGVLGARCAIELCRRLGRRLGVGGVAGEWQGCLGWESRSAGSCCGCEWGGGLGIAGVSGVWRG